MRNTFAQRLLCCFCLSVWCVFATPMHLKAEIIKPDVHHITTKSGLSHPHVYQSFQDSRGIMWFVTANGLNVYDGSSFHKAMDWGIPNMPWDIRIRAEDKLGRLWLQYNREFHVIDIRSRKRIQPDNISQLGKIKDVGTNWNNKLLIINTQGELWVENSANGWTKLCSLPDKHTYFASSKFRGSSIWLVSKQSDDGHMDFIALNPTGKLISRTHIRYIISGAWFTLDDDELLLVNREAYGRLSPNGDLRMNPINLDLTNETLPFINTWVAYDHVSQRLWINHRGKFNVYAIKEGNAIRIPALQDVHHIFRMYHDDAGNLSDLLQVNSAKTRAEAYDQAGNLHDVALRYTSDALEARASLSQNQPNPFSGETLIGFYLPEGGQAMLTLTDLQGRVLQVIRGEYSHGYHEIMVDGKHLPKGVIQYTLTCGEFTATRRMVLTR
jgi:hypothetical protein